MATTAMIALLCACILLGYKIIKGVPPQLHTPLMSGMNALSGITVLAALAVMEVNGASAFLGWMAIFLAAVNVTGGFWVTERMLGMFKKDKGRRNVNECK